MKTISLKAALVAMLLLGPMAGAALAKSFKLPEKNPAATMSIPDSWKPVEIDDGIQATSPDGSVYMSIEVGDVGNIDDLIENTFAYLKKNKVRIDDSTKKDSTTTVNGVEIRDFRWTGRDKDGPTEVGISFIPVAQEKVLLLTYWASPAGSKKYSDAIISILSSIKSR